MIARILLEIAIGKEFDYLIPEKLDAVVMVGSRVKVPFGQRSVMGFVTGLVEESSYPNLKAIESVVGDSNLVTHQVMRLARWMSEYYCCPLETALKGVLPDAVRKEEAGWKERLWVFPLEREGQMPKMTIRQEELLRFLQERGEVSLRDFVAEQKTTAGSLRRLESLGLIEIRPKIEERDPYEREKLVPTNPLELNSEQKKAYEEIVAALEQRVKGAGEGVVNGAGVFLLHGVTGSGKTEVYLQALDRCLELGRGAIVLVPEISLTPQTVERFKARFCQGPRQTLVAVLHSHLSAGERHDEWHKIRQGRARVVIGARSAIFAPVDPLGLIIVDEEHEYSYKQEEAPRYHARDLSVVRARLEEAVVVLGSATPSLESYWNAQKGKYRLLELLKRVDDKRMPVVKVVDMRSAVQVDQGPPVFSPQLKEGILQRLERKEQVMLFLNRRGYSSSLQCPKCGYVAGCPHCSVSLTFHRSRGQLLCHVCGHFEPAPQVCPQPACRAPGIRYSGLGTERVEEILLKMFPKAAIRRMDSDSVQRKGDYERILGEFRRGKVDILLGTQMITKGLHFPNVTLVGIVFADTALNLPDFRAGERTFQLITQVSGRAGRGEVEGEVFVQSFTPFHPAIQYSRRNDYLGFYEEEIAVREPLGYPPWARVALITFYGKEEEPTGKVAEDFRTRLQERACDRFPDLVMLGPAPSPLERAEDYYRFQIMLRTRQMPRLSRFLAVVQKEFSFPKTVRCSIDIDPVQLF